MSAPRLTRQLVLETQVKTPDGAGGYTTSWQPRGTLWAEVSARTGREKAGGAGALSSTQFRIRVRAAPFGAPSRPTADDRFREGARVFRILAVAEADATARYLICFAEEELAA